MDYITRNLETVVEQVTKESPIVLVTDRDRWERRRCFGN